MNDHQKTLNFKILLAFTDAYQTLAQEGVINEEELLSIMELLDGVEKRSLEEITDELKEIFPSSSLPNPAESNHSN